MGLKSKLITQIVRASIADLPQNVRNCPKAVTYDFISGTGRKGDFQIYSFFDDTGNLIKRNRIFKKGNNTTQEVSLYKSYEQDYIDCDSSILQTTTVKALNGKITSCKNSIQWSDLVRAEEEILQGTSYSSHRMLGLKKGKPPKEIAYKTNWDGKVPYDVQIKGGKFVMPDGAEYMPIFTSPQNPKRFNHLEQIALNQQELQGIVPKVKMMSRKQYYEENPYVNAYEQASGEGAQVGGDASPRTGQVSIINDEKNIANLVDTFAHEYQHVRDYSDLIRTQYALANVLKNERLGINPKGFKIRINDFKRKSLEKGLIEKGSDDYNRLINTRWIDEHENYDEICRNGLHDEAFMELSAIKKGSQEQNRFIDCINKVIAFLIN